MVVQADIDDLPEIIDWVITLTPSDPRYDQPGGNKLEILPNSSDTEDAVSALEVWAGTLKSAGVIPDSMDFRSLSVIDVLRRVGRFAFYCRADCFEFETDAGYSNGYCWLRAEQKLSPGSAELP